MEVDIFTADREQQIEDETVTSGAVDTNGHLILTRHDGSTVDAGSVALPTVLNPLVAWPVGSIFMSTVSTNPATLLGGGTWAAWGTGRVPVAIDAGQTEFATNGQTGGAKTHDHTFAGHTHTQGSLVAQLRMGTSDALIQAKTASVPAYNVDTSVAGASPGTSVSTSRTNAVSVSGTTDSATADSDPASNLPPYIVCYMWRRTA